MKLLDNLYVLYTTDLIILKNRLQECYSILTPLENSSNIFNILHAEYNPIIIKFILSSTVIYVTGISLWLVISHARSFFWCHVKLTPYQQICILLYILFDKIGKLCKLIFFSWIFTEGRGSINSTVFLSHIKFEKI